MDELRSISDADLYARMSEVRENLEVLPRSLEEIIASPLGKEVRRRAKQDLFFYAKYFVGFDNKANDLYVEHVHRRLCDMFVQKDDSKEIGEQSWRKGRMILYPRGSMKSVTNVMDASQWILNFPNIRILIMTAADGLAVGFVDLLKGHFVKRTDMPSFMNIFFPEFCLTEKEFSRMSAYEFRCPKCTISKRAEATVMASSITSTLSGFHFDVIKADDMVSNRNSENEEQCVKLIKNFAINRKMLMLWGYLDIIGTRYHEMDYYGDLLEKNVGRRIKTEKDLCWETVDNEDTGFKILIGRAVVPKPGFEHKKFEELTEEEVYLLFPEYLSLARLKQEYLEGTPEAFEGQMNQNPRPLVSTVFDRALLLKRTIPPRNIPINGPVVITWDFAFSSKKARDYTTGAVGIFNDKGQLFIVDLVRARFKPKELAQAVVDLACKWYPQTIGVENAGGSQLIEPAVINEAKQTGKPEIMAVCQRIDWIKVDTQDDAKKSRMRTLHPLLMDEMLFFSSSLPYLDVLYKEFEVCLVTSRRHNDIPDVIAQQLRYLPRMSAMIQKNEISTWSKDDAAWNIYFAEGNAFGRVGMGGNPPVKPAELEEGLKAEAPEGLDPVLGSGLYG